MKYVSKKLFVSFVVFPCLANADFDFGGDGEGCDGGSGSFEQQINHYGGDYEKSITVGPIQKGLKDVSISLKSDKDVDIRLYDVNGKKIVHWPNGILSNSKKESKVYNGVTVEYSGYNGDGSGVGHEYIKISGTTKNDFIMKAFGYQAGYAKVDYSWTGKENCSGGGSPSSSGNGDFEKQIIKNAIVEVGPIPPGVNNLYISLKSDKDLDIQLYDKDNGKKIVHWPDGIMSGSSTQSTLYENMEIEWSGYSGDNNSLGNEYIKITGKTTRNLIMKAYGFQAGYAQVHYKWGEDDAPVTLKGLKFVSASPASGKSYAEAGEKITFKVGTYSNENEKIKVYIQFHTGAKYLSKVAMIKKSDSLWIFDRALKAGKQKKYKVTVTDLDGNTVGTQEKSIEVKDSLSISSKVMGDYVNSVINKCIDMDSSWGCQCMDLMHHYIAKVLGIPRSVSPLVSKGPNEIYFVKFKGKNSITLSYGSKKVRLDKIPNTLTSIPKVGDIIIWKAAKSNGYYGHVGMFISGDANSFKSIDQNWYNASLKKGSPAKIVSHNYNDVAGYLRPVILSK